MSAANLTKRIVNAVAAEPSGARSRVRKTGKAQILTPELLDHLLHHIQATSRDPLRDYAIVLFSFKAGLRAGEIAGLSWRDVTDPRNRVGRQARNPTTGEMEAYFEVPNGIAKKGHGRMIPMHPALLATLEALQKHMGLDAQPDDPVIRSLNLGRENYSPRISANTLVVYIKDLYLRAGLQGCSSHSGRRTAITQLAQTANKHGCSLFDVQQYAGHANIGTTETYVELSPNAGRMVRSL